MRTGALSCPPAWPDRPGAICNQIWYHLDMDAVLLLTEARRRSGLSRRELARRGRTSASTLAAYESGVSVPSVVTLTRLLQAAGFDAEVTLRPATTEDDRGRATTIEALMAFTDALPRTERGPLDCPVFDHQSAAGDR